jgi:hypothetical protein
MDRNPVQISHDWTVMTNQYQGRRLLRENPGRRRNRDSRHLACALALFFIPLAKLGCVLNRIQGLSSTVPRHTQAEVGSSRLLLVTVIARKYLGTKWAGEIQRHFTTDVEGGKSRSGCHRYLHETFDMLLAHALRALTTT